MNNVLDSINRIDAVVQEADMQVTFSVMDIIDKNELIQEYAEDTELPEIFFEYMMWYMESNNRERDKTPRNEIAQWMEKKGYWYTGDNPKKKKECNRMYHFLQQHKFDPKDETYETEYGKDGKPHRLKFHIDAGAPNFSKDQIDEIKRGENMFYSSFDDSVSMGSKVLKGKQSASQYEIKHEEGHGEDRYNKKMTKSGSQDRYSKEESFINNARKRGYRINDHDLGGDELRADAYSAAHAKKRVKGAGANHGQVLKNFDADDLKRGMMSIDRLVADCGDDIDTLVKTLKGTKATIHRIKENISKADAYDFKFLTRSIKLLNDQIPSLKLSNKIVITLTKIADKFNSIKNKYAHIKELDESVILERVQLNNEKSKKYCSMTLSGIKKLYGYVENASDKMFETGAKVLNTKIVSKNLDELEDCLTKAEKECEEFRNTNEGFKTMTTRMRYAYAKQFVKEYFAELSNDYYFAE